MIRAEKGAVEVNGEVYDVLFELTHLLGNLIKRNPNLITSVISVYTDELENAIDIANPRACKIMSIIAGRIKKDLEDE